MQPADDKALLVVELVCEIRGQGAFLSPDEYNQISEWAEKCGNDVDLVSLISDDLEQFCHKRTKAGAHRKITGMRQKINKKIEQMRFLQTEH